MGQMNMWGDGEEKCAGIRNQERMKSVQHGLVKKDQLFCCFILVNSSRFLGSCPEELLSLFVPLTVLREQQDC